MTLILSAQSRPGDRTLNIFRYFFGKASDVKRLNRNDALLGKIVLDIHRKRLSSSKVSIPLGDLQPIHPIDRDEARATVRERAAVVAAHRAEILQRGTLSEVFLHEFLPSISNIKVVDLGERRFVAFEGNGRLAAIREGLGVGNGDELDDAPTVEIEVDCYHLDARARKTLKRRIERVRRWNGLGPLA